MATKDPEKIKAAKLRYRAKTKLTRPHTRPPDAEAIRRFWGYVARTDDSCWEWTGALTRQGYGRFPFGDGTLRAHRVAWVLAHGPIPDGQMVCHRCDNPQCVRPDHLFLGSAADNVADMFSKQRHAIGTERHPHTTNPLIRAHGTRNAAAKLTDDQVDEIRRLAAVQPRPTYTELAARFGVSRTLVSSILLGKVRVRRTVSLDEARRRGVR